MKRLLSASAWYDSSHYVCFVLSKANLQYGSNHNRTQQVSKFCTLFLKRTVRLRVHSLHKSRSWNKAGVTEGARYHLLQSGRYHDRQL